MKNLLRILLRRQSRNQSAGEILKIRHRQIGDLLVFLGLASRLPDAIHERILGMRHHKPDELLRLIEQPCQPKHKLRDHSLLHGVSGDQKLNGCGELAVEFGIVGHGKNAPKLREGETIWGPGGYVDRTLCQGLCPSVIHAAYERHVQAELQAKMQKSCGPP